MADLPALALPLALLAECLVAGAVAGGAARRLLGRLRRGAVVRPGWCEGGVSVLWGVAGWRAGVGALPFWWLSVALVLTWFAVPLAATDLCHRRLPDALTLPAYPAIAGATLAAAGLGGGWALAVGAAVGAGALLTLHAAIHLVSPGSLGPGDVKLSGSLGVVLGAIGWPAVLLATGLAAALTLLLRALSPRRIAARWRDGIPHGPGLLAATSLLALFPQFPGMAS